MPLEICKLSRSSRSKICKEQGYSLLDKGCCASQYSNSYVDIDARISELGRQPYSARDFMIKYQDRILFGTDNPPSHQFYSIYYRFLETRDQYMDSSAHGQGRWRLYGLYLPDEVLEKLYNKNAMNILSLRK